METFKPTSPFLHQRYEKAFEGIDTLLKWDFVGKKF
jgi:hypothetical protein